MTNTRKLKLKTTSIFNKNLTANTDIVVNRGGTRSSKTYSLCQLMCFKLISEPNKRIIIARKTFPSLRHSVLKDMITMLKELGIYDLGHHNKSEHTLIIGDRVEYEHLENKGRIYAINLKKI